ncbi:cell division protein FtsA [Herbivorax sp. ANBcel31]|uniref:cell division protein FtsA n=1 Tax=Herbivorax sp. ANBcel31 TaxID=3069754 RepID=UPI0027AEA821|nr:cell division protein FtsA [Herbivorax sp. ANBcel31]MDQ2085912.1 cell division protein FtsA [Herbivorax sp. ANBcel31]
MDDIICCIDIGTSKVCAVVAKVNRFKNIEVLGKSMKPCNCVKKGVIVDIDEASSIISSCISEIRAIKNIEINSAYVNIMGNQVSIVSNKSSVETSNSEHEITKKDIERVLFNVEKVNFPKDRQIIDVIPSQYIVDGCDEIVDPLGMSGGKLEVEADIIAGKITSVQNIVKSMEKANVEVEGIIVEALAISELSLTSQEKEMGVVLIDIGGSITNVSLFKNERVVFYDSLPVGGAHITNDISIGLRISLEEAEKLKREYELALTSLIKNDYEISVNDINENKKREIRVSEVIEIIEARVHEIFYLCKELLEKNEALNGFDGSIVLAGGGISYVDGNMQLAYEVFGYPVRVASHKVPGVSKPEFLTSIGTVKYVAKRMKMSKKDNESKNKIPEKPKQKFRLLKKIYKFFTGLF